VFLKRTKTCLSKSYKLTIVNYQYIGLTMHSYENYLHSFKVDLQAKQYWSDRSVSQAASRARLPDGNKVLTGIRQFPAKPRFPYLNTMGHSRKANLTVSTTNMGKIWHPTRQANQHLMRINTHIEKISLNKHIRNKSYLTILAKFIPAVPSINE
jgi:hypothetical protein